MLEASFKRLTTATLALRMIMATSQCTTQQSKSVEIKRCRELTVGYLPGSARAGTYPRISLAGRWLEQLGFLIGSKVKVEVSQGRLVIEQSPPGEVYKADALRRLAIAERMLMAEGHSATKCVADSKQEGAAQ
jgi:toxic protein SymE